MCDVAWFVSLCVFLCVFENVCVLDVCDVWCDVVWFVLRVVVWLCVLVCVVVHVFVCVCL